MVKQMEQNKALIEEKNNLLRRLEEIKYLIDENVNTYRMERGKMAEKNTEPASVEEANGPKLSIQERFVKTKELIAAGKKNSEIAKELNCSVTYVYNVRLGKVVAKEPKAVKEPKAKK